VPLPQAQGGWGVTQRPTVAYYRNSNQYLNAGQWNVIYFNVAYWDSHGRFYGGYYFQPQVAGFYQINLLVRQVGTETQYGMYSALFVNGALFRYGKSDTVNGTPNSSAQFSGVIYLDADDYVYFCVYPNAAMNIEGTFATCWFDAHFVYA
jgi:hypothetical protein